MAELVRRLPLPQRLREAGVQAGELAEIASETMSDYMMANLPKPLSQEEVLGLLRQAW
jgi:alcohol dehydrogenase class IV